MADPGDWEDVAVDDWEDVPAPEPVAIQRPEVRPAPAKEPPGGARGAVASFIQGPLYAFADEAAGMLGRQNSALKRLGRGFSEEEKGQIYTKAQGYVREGMFLSDALQRAAKEMQAGAADYKQGRDVFRAQEAGFRKEHPALGVGLTTLGGLAGGPVAAKGLARYLIAAAEGGLTGMGASNEAEGMGRGAALGAPLGVAGQAFGDALGYAGSALFGKGANAAGRRVAGAETKAETMAAEKVAAEIASAKGKLGAVTQEGNRSVENLMRLGETLTPEQQYALSALEQNGTLPALRAKLADSMLEQVPSAASRIDGARASMEGLVNNAPKATQDAANSILSGSEAKRQLMERVRRYLPTVAGSIGGASAGGAASLALGGGMGETLVGALAGAGIRPAVRAVQRMAAHPSVQRATFQPLQSLALGAEGAIQSAAPALADSATRAGTAELEKYLDALGLNPSRGLVEALRRRKDNR